MTNEQRPRIWTIASAVLALMLLLTGCGGTEDAAEDTAADDDAASTDAAAEDADDDAADAGGDGDLITVGFSQVGAESGWRAANTESIQTSLTEENGFDLRFSDAQQRQENQIQALRSFIAQGVDVISFSPVVETGWEGVLEEARAADIPVVLTDRAVDVEDESLYVSFIGSDFVEEGRRAGQWVSEELGTEPINVVELQGTTGSAPALDRKEGFEEAIADNPNVTITASQTGNFTRSEGRQVMEGFLQSEDDIDVLFAHNDDMGLGAIEAIEAAGLVPGEDIIIVTIDGVRDGMEALAQGKISYIVECNPLLGPDLAEIITAVHNGEEVEARIVVEDQAFTSEEAAEVLEDRLY